MLWLFPQGEDTAIDREIARDVFAVAVQTVYFCLQTWMEEMQVKGYHATIVAHEAEIVQLLRRRLSLEGALSAFAAFSQRFERIFARSHALFVWGFTLVRLT